MVPSVLWLGRQMKRLDVCQWCCWVLQDVPDRRVSKSSPPTWTCCLRSAVSNCSAYKRSRCTLTQSSSWSWKDCPVPSLLGVPLELQRLAPHLPRPDFEQPAVLLLMDPLTGFAPMDVQFSGLGEVLLARTDGACQISLVQCCGRAVGLAAQVGCRDTPIGACG